MMTIREANESVSDQELNVRWDVRPRGSKGKRTLHPLRTVFLTHMGCSFRMRLSVCLTASPVC